MNELLAHEIGRVLGMAQLETDTCMKAKTPLEQIFGMERRGQIIRDSEHHVDALKKIAQENGVADIVFESAQIAERTLQLLRDLYVNEKWQDVTVIGEWSAIVEGLAMTRWAIIRGAIETLVEHEHSVVHNDLLVLATDASHFHYGILHDGLTYFHKLGAEGVKTTTKSDLTE